MTAQHPNLSLVLALFMGLSLAACAQFPEVDRAQASGPETVPAVSRLQPLDGLLDDRSFAPIRAGASTAALDGRAAALRQRAAALRKIKPAE